MSSFARATRIAKGKQVTVYEEASVSLVPSINTQIVEEVMIYWPRYKKEAYLIIQLAGGRTEILPLSTDNIEQMKKIFPGE